MPAGQIPSPKAQPVTGNDPAISKINKVDQIHLSIKQNRRKKQPTNRRQKYYPKQHEPQLNKIWKPNKFINETDESSPRK